jgi:hypothetical protein
MFLKRILPLLILYVVVSDVTSAQKRTNQSTQALTRAQVIDRVHKAYFVLGEHGLAGFTTDVTPDWNTFYHSMGRATPAADEAAKLFSNIHFKLTFDADGAPSLTYTGTLPESDMSFVLDTAKVFDGLNRAISGVFKIWKELVVDPIVSDTAMNFYNQFKATDDGYINVYDSGGNKSITTISKDFRVTSLSFEGEAYKMGMQLHSKKWDVGYIVDSIDMMIALEKQTVRTGYHIVSTKIQGLPMPASAEIHVNLLGMNLTIPVTFSNYVLHKDTVIDGAAKAEILRKARAAYYSLSNRGLVSFKATVTPDWELFLTSMGNPDSNSMIRRRIQAMKGFRYQLSCGGYGGITLTHTGTATAQDAAMIDTGAMNKDLEKIVKGAMQLWMQLSFPQIFSADSLYTIKSNGTAYEISSEQSGAKSAIQMATDLKISGIAFQVLSMKGVFYPHFLSTPDGFVLDGIDQQIEVNGDSVGGHIEVEPKLIDGFWLPTVIRSIQPFEKSTMKIALTFSDFEVKTKQ